MIKEICQLRSDFPALGQLVSGQPLVYLDHAATSLKPLAVIETIDHFYRHETANVHRGAHYLSDKATQKYEDARTLVKNFINAENNSEIVFTKGTTESINLVAQAYGDEYLNPGDEIILTEMEHHSNIVPWQILAKRKKLTVKWVPVTESGELDLNEFKNILNEKTKIVSVVHCSNVLGTVNNIKAIISAAHNVGAKVLVDAAQSVTFMPIDVQDLNCDFLVFSAHKLYGPFGTGVLFGKSELLNAMPPYQSGGSMITSVSKDESLFLGAPQKFEAGTPNVSGAIALGAAIKYVEKIGLANICAHETELLQYTISELNKINGVRIIGNSSSRVNIVSFVTDGIHGADIGQILDQQGVAIRTGHHCAQPLMNKLKLTGTMRVSLGVYNSREDVDIFIRSLNKAVEMLS
ncbi:MAG: cysteine desulfurase [Bdellovibrionales bacterium]|nr:cysteine desulfurase [Bdellovibrionales bacterium]